MGKRKSGKFVPKVGGIIKTTLWQLLSRKKPLPKFSCKIFHPKGSQLLSLSLPKIFYDCF